MPFIVIVIGALIAITAFNQTYDALAKALVADIPGYFKWGIAIAAILGLGYVPGMKVPSRYLIALVALVVILTNYKTIFGGFTQFAQSSGSATGQGAAEPTAAYVQSGGASGLPTQAQIAGDPGGATGSTSATQVASATASATGTGGQVLTAAQNLAANPLNPNSYIGLAAGFGGLG